MTPSSLTQCLVPHSANADFAHSTLRLHKRDDFYGKIPPVPYNLEGESPFDTV